MILFNIDNNTSRLLNFNLPSEISSNAGLGVYAKKLYLLDTGQNQIYKYNYTDGGFSSPTEWLAEKIDLSGYSSLAIDGNIWLSAKNGNIAKFFKGKQEILKITGCNQAISDNTSVYTDDTLDYIYIIDMDNNQIILTDKQGKVANNLVIKNLEKIKSAFPAPDEKIIYLLTDKNIYEINL